MAGITNDDFTLRLMRKLEPTEARRTLQHAAALLIGWELIQSEIVDKVRNFFTYGFDQSGLIVDERYQERVVARAVRIFDGSVEWLVETGGLTSEQAAGLKHLRDYRNTVAHELAVFLIDPDKEIDLSRLEAMRDVVGSLGRFWGQIEVDINPDFDGREVDPQDILSGPMMLFDYALSVLQDEPAEAESG